ncbi:MAG: amino acid adenylation domain-containing protein, partial [bacterium]|nr:amino acid adenylation domain-containing protein [bacterium]
KGVVVEHTSAVNILTALQKLYPLQERDVYLFKTSYIFDVSVTEIFGWYLAGGSLALLEKDGEKDPQSILEAVETFGVTHINFVPSMFNAFVDTLETRENGHLWRLKYIFLAGEALLPGTVERFKRLNTDVTMEDIYGPTEATIYACGYPLSQWDGTGPIPIGTPLQNIQLFILDRNDNLQPVGVAGELHISGDCLARGYLNRPE